ncbi:hypothetical protein OS493_025862 [Desmophyllum pertusum]|uniref:CUB domain-containing protein n=1 Tax=Desmophyllum pertusum TaxID=174260 RepID=A0A9X0CPZ6_9CNID|nr:hypothetical protein OS493_025862 [Desmophyllum pertusum]
MGNSRKVYLLLLLMDSTSLVVHQVFFPLGVICGLSFIPRLANGKDTSFKARFEALDPPAISTELCFPGNIDNSNLELTGSSGTLQSPEKDSVYLSHMSCDWLITVPDGKTVKLSFDRFELRPSTMSSTCIDYLEILDGKNSNSESKGKFCGFTIPEDGIRSSGRYMRVRFRSAVEVPVAASSKELCFPGNINNNDLELTGSHGTLQSPEEKPLRLVSPRFEL